MQPDVRRTLCAQELTSLSIFVKAASVVWKLTPSKRLRSRYLAAYYWLVRGQHRIVTKGDVTLSLDLSESIDVAVMLDRFEPEVVAVADRKLRPGNVVLDIGANAGVHALHFASRVRPGGRVYAFEPTDSAFARLTQNVKLNPALPIEAIQTALSDEDRDGAEIDFRSSWRTDGALPTAVSRVRMSRLDTWSGENRLEKFDFLKLDVDGYEFAVLSGATATLRRFTPFIIMEAGLYHFDDDSRNPFRLLAALGYRFADASTGTPLEIDALLARLRSPEMNGLTMNVVGSADPQG
jgi:FkbM family methyltransferase